MDANGHRYVDNRNFILLNYDHLDDGPMIYSMASTGVAPSRKLLTLADAIKVRKPNPDYNPAIAGSPRRSSSRRPLWSNVWKLRASYFEASPNGYYQISDIERVGWVSKQYAPEIVELFSSFQQLDGTIIRGAEPTEPAGPAPQTEEAKVADRVFGPRQRVQARAGQARLARPQGRERRRGHVLIQASSAPAPLRQRSGAFFHLQERKYGQLQDSKAVRSNGTPYCP